MVPQIATFLEFKSVFSEFLVLVAECDGEESAQELREQHTFAGSCSEVRPRDLKIRVISK
jgi:hypothetical protein